MFETNANGVIQYQNKFKISGPDLYVNSKGLPSIPVGSISIQEKNPPTGYLKNDELKVVHFTWDATKGRVVNDCSVWNTTNQMDDLTVKSYEPPISGGISITKTDAATGKPVNGDASVAGIKFAIVNANDNPVTYGTGTTEYSAGCVVAILTVGSDGKAATPANTLPYGKYSVYELRSDATIAVGEKYSDSTKLGSSPLSNVDYKYATNSGEVTLTEDGTTKNLSFTDYSHTGTGNIKKTDKDMTTKQGDADFAGIQYAVVNRSANAVGFGGKTYAVGAVIAIATLDDGGNASVTGLPAGTYDFIELSLNHTAAVGTAYAAMQNGKSVYANNSGYLYNAQTKTLTIKAGETKSADFTDGIVRGGVKVTKIDAETGGEAQSVATLKDAKISIVNTSKAPVCVNGMTYAVGATVMTIETDENGIAETPANALPYGTYTLTETKESAGYNLNSSWSATITIRENGMIVEPNSSTAVSKLPEYVKRADLQISKLDIDGNPMPYIPFLIELLDKDGNTVEAHVVVTDANGFVDTSTLPKTGPSVNCLDSYVSGGAFTDESLLTGGTGVWFGAPAVPGSGTGALVLGNYRVSELRCAANAGNDMLTRTLFDTNDPSMIFVNGQKYVLNGYVDLIVHLESDAEDALSGSKTSAIGKATEIIDSVRYDHLKITNTYKIVTEAFYIDRDGSSPVSVGTGEKTFTPVKADATNTSFGIEDVTLTVDTESLTNGGAIHLVDKLYRVMTDGTEVPIVSHNTDLKDERQMVYVPFMRTKAKDTRTGDQVGTSDKDSAIVDTVIFENLGDKGMYLFEATLRYADTGEVVTGTDGKPCVVTQIARCSWKASGITPGTVAVVPRSGELDMPAFRFDGTALQGRPLVVTEVLKDYDTGDMIIDHNDLEDPDQTVYIPNVKTEATDKNTGTHTAVVGKTTITDKVTIENLVVGQTYVVKGDLVYQADCKDANGTEHKKGDVIATHAGTSVTAKNTTEVVYLDYEVDASLLEGVSGVVFEDVWHNDVKVARHHDFESEAQTVNFPKVRTTAVDGQTNSNTGVVGGTATIVDTAALLNLTVGDTYKVSGILMNSDGTEFTVDGKTVTAESEVFTADKKDMSVEVIFSFDSSAIAGKSLVVFEQLINVTLLEDVEVASHEDLTDLGQTIDYPSGRTNASDGQTKDHTGMVGQTTITDIVTYENLRVGETYTITGDLHYCEDCTDVYGVTHMAGDVVLDKNGEPITATDNFEAETKTGTRTLTYEVDSTLLQGTGIVVFEDFIVNDVTVFSHADIDDEDQRIDYPEVRTTAADIKTEDNVGSVGSTTVTDLVELNNLTVGNTYTVEGILMDVKTGEPFLEDGKEVTAAYGSFEATDTVMTVTLDFAAENGIPAGKTVVVFEGLYHNNVKVAAHEDITDGNQSVYYPVIHTTAKADDTEDHVTNARSEIRITDEVVYENLLTDGRTYTVSGYLVDKVNGQPILIDGEKITAEKTFIPTEKSGTEILEFVFDGSALKGTTIVVFENVYYNDIKVATHADISDKEQTVYVPEIRTHANDIRTEIDHTLVEKEAVVVDTVTYTNLLPGKEYTVRGYLADKKTGEPILIDGKKIENEHMFTAETATGETEIRFTFDATVLAGDPIVVFETLYYNDIEIAAHCDIEDEDQSDYIPEIGTKAKADDTDGQVTEADEEIVIIDTVSYGGLKPNTKYEVKGTLMDKATGEPILLNGVEVTGGTTFVTGDADDGEAGVSGTVDIAFTFDGSALKGTTIVVFESLYQSGKEVAVHADIEDEAQTVYVPGLRTTATDTATETHTGHLDEEMTIEDEVVYRNLLPGKTYTVKGVLMNKETGKPLLADGEEITAETEFMAEDENGSVVLEFVFDSTSLAGTQIVVFEYMYYEGIEVAVHADLEDRDQTVYVPEIGTQARDQASGSQVMTLGDKVSLVDTVAFKGMTPGMKYIVKGEVIDKATGTGIGVTAEAEFVPETEDGETFVSFTINTNSLQGKTLVVFEAVYDVKGNLIAEHKDPDDNGQTVTVPMPPQTPPVITGDNHDFILWISIFGAAVLTLITVAFILKFGKKKKEQQG